MRLACATYLSPIGPLGVVAGPTGLCRVEFGGDPRVHLKALERRFGPVELVQSEDPGGAVTALRRYFGGELQALATLAVDPGGTPFQVAVWLGLRGIRAGHTWSYAELAERLGRPRAVRAVGAANGANPIAIVLPCHRVVGSDGTLTGYGGGLERKEWLLRHERARL